MRVYLPARFFTAAQKKVPLAYELQKHLQLPEYLEKNYWWAYIHPKAVYIFERQWLVNLILLGNFKRLRECALQEFSGKAPENTLQVACVYGNLTEKLAEKIPQTHIDVVDIAPIQLENLSKKVANYGNVFLHHQDSTSLQFKDNSYDSVLVFFLLHEQPNEVKMATVKEAIRVAKPGAKVIFVDFHNPSRFNPWRYFMIPILKNLEPFALDMWNNKLENWLPPVKAVTKETYFGGLYQKVVCIK